VAAADEKCVETRQTNVPQVTRRATPSALTSAAAAMRQRQRLVSAARPLQLAARLVAPAVRAAHRLRLRPRADDPAVAVPVSDQPLRMRNTRCDAGHVERPPAGYD